MVFDYWIFLPFEIFSRAQTCEYDFFNSLINFIASALSVWFNAMWLWQCVIFPCGVLTYSTHAASIRSVRKSLWRNIWGQIHLSSTCSRYAVSILSCIFWCISSMVVSIYTANFPCNECDKLRHWKFLLQDWNGLEAVTHFILACILKFLHEELQQNLQASISFV